jgi:hypothetical protein
MVKVCQLAPKKKSSAIIQRIFVGEKTKRAIVARFQRFFSHNCRSLGFLITVGFSLFFWKNIRIKEQRTTGSPYLKKKSESNNHSSGHLKKNQN